MLFFWEIKVEILDKINNSSYLCRPVLWHYKVGGLNIYNIELKNMREDSCQYEYALTDRFFADIDAPEIQKGNLKVSLSVKKSIGIYILNFHIEGDVVVSCDRCLDDLTLPVNIDETLKVKFGSEYADNDEIIIVTEEEGCINIAWFIYEFVELSLPMKHVHAPGECNQTMAEALNRHLATSVTEEEDYLADDDEEEESGETDPRWNELKKILDNN